MCALFYQRMLSKLYKDPNTERADNGRCNTCLINCKIPHLASSTAV